MTYSLFPIIWLFHTIKGDGPFFLQKFTQIRGDDIFKQMIVDRFCLRHRNNLLD